jgi:hypothetical protein
MISLMIPTTLAKCPRVAPQIATPTGEGWGVDRLSDMRLARGVTGVPEGELRGDTPRLCVVVPPALLAAARQATDAPDATTSELVRLALAQLAGVDVADYTPKRGRTPRRRPATDQAALPGLGDDSGRPADQNEGAAA